VGFVVFPPSLLEDLAEALDDERHLLIVELGGINGNSTWCRVFFLLLRSLPESQALPSARSTRQSPKNTRQKLCRVSHSAKKARHTVHRRSLLCRVLFLEHSEKRFAERQRALGKEKQPLRRRVTETAALLSVPGDTRQRSYLCRVSARQHSAKALSLPSATCDTRQRTRQGGSPCQVLCRVSETLHSAKNLYRCPGLGSFPSVMALTLGKAPLCRV
jgi:hypothetical protein